MDDKFILIGLEDAGDVAEALKNKTCKKILNYLAEIKEASEKDISDALKIPMNTAEYSLKKLIKIGLVEKTKAFFWSVKGKKIPMYKLAKKHIIISPNKKFDLGYLKNMLPVVFIMGLIGIFIKFIFENKTFENNLFEGSRNLKDAVITAPSTANAESLTGISNIQLSNLDKLLMLPFIYWFLAGALIGVVIYFMFKKCKETAFLLKRNPGERITFPRKVNQNQSFSKDCKEVKNGKIN